MRILDALAAADRAALDAGLACSGAARMLAIGAASIMPRLTAQVVEAAMRHEEEQARARVFAELQTKVGVSHRWTDDLFPATYHVVPSGGSFTPSVDGSHWIVIDDLVEPAPSIERLRHSGASAELVLGELTRERVEHQVRRLVAGKGWGKMEAMRQWLASLPELERPRVVGRRDGEVVVLPSPHDPAQPDTHRRAGRGYRRRWSRRNRPAPARG